jgi:hypothetical protein
LLVLLADGGGSGGSGGSGHCVLICPCCLALMYMVEGIENDDKVLEYPDVGTE